MIFRKLLLAALIALAPVSAIAAALLPNGEQVFLDNNGTPLAGGTVTFYVPSTTTPKDTWQDPDQNILNTNPVVLDAAGRAVIYGVGAYRQIVKDSLGNLIWDQLSADPAGAAGVSWGGTSTGSANAQVITASGFSGVDGQQVCFKAGFSNSGPMTLTTASSSAIPVRRDEPAGPLTLAGGEVVTGNIVCALYDVTLGAFHLIENPQYSIGVLTNLASATTSDLGSIPSHNVNVTGTTTITSFGSSASTAYPIYYITFAGSLTLTQNASSLILPGGVNITTAAGDTAIAAYLGSGNWRVISFTAAAVSPSATLPAPQGRLTLTTGVPVMSSNTTAQGTVYYTPYTGNVMPVFAGAGWVSQTFSEMALVLDAVGHPSGNNYDVFSALDGTTLRICTGPAWTNSTSRSAGTAIVLTSGRYVNNASLTCRYNSTTFTVGAGAGLYLGSFRTSGNGQTTWNPQPAAAAGGGNAQAFLWNMYNRVSVSAWSLDNTNSWPYTTLTWRSANGSDSNRISALFGLNEDGVTAQVNAQASNSSGGPDFYAGIGLDSTSAIATGSLPGRSVTPGGAGDIGFTSSSFTGLPGLGLHFFQWLEAAEASATTTFYGDNNVPTFVQTGIQAQLRM